jgi:hypothetical protein
MKPFRPGAAAALAGLLVLGLAPTTPSAAAGRRVDAQLRRTVSCATELRALQIFAFATNPGAGTAAAVIGTGDPNVSTSLLAVDTRYQRYKLNGSCHSIVRHVVLSHRGLTSAGVVHAGDRQSPSVYCSAPRHVLVRFLLGFGASHKPVSATIEVLTQPKPHSGKKPKRIGFVQWSPQRSVTYYSPACTSQS